MKFCIACKHCIPEATPKMLCSASPYGEATISMVTGEPLKPYQRYWPCEESRGDADKCGKDGTKWEAKS